MAVSRATTIDRQDLKHSLLGRQVALPSTYSPSLLHSITRRPTTSQPVFDGEDTWHAWELSWLDEAENPAVAVARLVFPATSPRIIESKSLKFYLFSLSEKVFPNPENLSSTIAADLGAAAGADVQVQLLDPESEALMPQRLASRCLDGLTAVGRDERPEPGYLQPRHQAAEVNEICHTHRFRSLCPVTGQPDWATVQIAYAGTEIERTSLLRYLRSYRHHEAFHEQCVEQIWNDICRAVNPLRLSVQAAFLRRGGLDISPARYTPGSTPPDLRRTLRQ